MELHAVDFPRFVADADGRAGLGMRAEAEALRHLRHIVAVAHPCNALLLQTMEQLAARVKERLRFSVFPRGILLRSRDLAAEVMGDQLTAIADTEDGQTQFKNCRIDLRRAFSVDALRAAGKNKADRLELHQLRQRRGTGLDLAVYVILTHTARDQLVVLSAKIQNNDALLCLHCKTSH